MIIIVNGKAGEKAVQDVVNEVEALGLRTDISYGVDSVTVGLVGDVSLVNPDKITMLTGVEKVIKVSEPFKLANRKFHPDDTVVDVKGVKIGGQSPICVMAGPCSVESEEQILQVAKAVKKSGASILRGGAYKPRTSPYAFQGLEEEGIRLLQLAGKEVGMPVVSEMTSVRQLDVLMAGVDMIQVGARNMQNFEMLKEIGKTQMPVLLKRGLSSTIEEWLMSAEYIMSRGNKNVILCERGIRTFETFTRNTLDLSSVVAVKELSHLPVIADPSHGSGKYWMIEPLSLAGIAVGADGLMIEVHNDPARALSDGPQSLTPERFESFMQKAQPVAAAVNRTMA